MREALLEKGALLYASRGVRAVTSRELHQAVGSKNESAVNYYFGGHDGLLGEILRIHLEAIESRRQVLVADLEAHGRTGDMRGLVHALAAPMADDLFDPVGRAHLRIVAQLSHPALAYEDAFRSARSVKVEPAAGVRVVRWLREALPSLPRPVQVERLVSLRWNLLGAFGQRAHLIDDDEAAGDRRRVELFLENLLDEQVAALTAEPSEATVAAARRAQRAKRSSAG